MSEVLQGESFRQSLEPVGPPQYFLRGPDHCFLQGSALWLMQPNELLDSTTTPDGQPITLTREAGYYVIRVSRSPLMSSAMHGSEEALAELGCERLAKHKKPRVLVGGGTIK